jgi:pimeloyl-ACP methyl ester carboxylesterase
VQVVVDRVVRLPDGRSMGYAQYGSDDGFPIVNAHGGLACRLDVAAANAVAAEADVRLISPDRPGIGLSDPQPGRTVLDWANDVADLFDRIEVDRFAVMGWSMGGQYAAAVGHAMPLRVTRLAIIAGALPLTDPGVFDELPTMDRVLTRMSHLVPWLVAQWFRLCASQQARRRRSMDGWLPASWDWLMARSSATRLRRVRPGVQRGVAATVRRCRGVSGLAAPVGFRARGSHGAGRRLGGDARRTSQLELAAAPCIANSQRHLEYSRGRPLPGAPVLPGDLRGAYLLVQVDAAVVE